MRVREAAGLATVLLLLVLVPVLAPTPASARDGEVVNVVPPTVTGEAVWGGTLTADGGTWDPAAVALTYRWLRDGQAVRGATASTYRLGGHDLGTRLAVEVTATTTDGTDGTGGTGRATSAPTVRVVRAELVNRRDPRIVGEARYGRVVTARPGRWSTAPDRLRYRWLLGGERVRGARSARYRLAPGDVGRRLRVEVTAYADGHEPATARSAAVTVRHRVDVRRTVTYSVTTRGRVTASLREFRRQVQQTYDDARGWRGKGVRFRPVGRGGSFTVVLAEASTVPSFSSGCSSTYSCRVGRHVIINQTRWQTATPPWNGAGRSLRDYRHLVVNHETGHWLGKGHAGCARRGALAPVMMQQSKGTDGCRFNPWPTLAELR
ncbi:DUF3152 domain-containing protein [Nocardioides sp.]|uniref:DUF3152 domain-containing protein n=1 Tax=Nocardioides sp. TaxID=35761 RepID=UPI0027166C7B|nr:DUF3152 domain-containing protein [Nocardioides sp.]MDO9455763.1 DUF3152 domain-containing protein [Nocardioides sp.]